METQEGEYKEKTRGGMNVSKEEVCLTMMKQEVVSGGWRHSHLQNRLQLLQFRFLLLDFTVVVLAHFSQQQTGDIQHFL